MFKNHAAELFRWVAVVILQIAIALIAIRRSKKRNPQFTRFACAKAAGSPLLMFVALSFRNYYALAYYLLSAAWWVLFALMAEETLKNVFCRSGALHEVLKKRLALLCAISYIVVISCTALWRPTNSTLLLNVVRTGELVLIAATGATLLILRLFARRIGFVWRYTDAAIAHGLIVFLSLEFLSTLVQGNSGREIAQVFVTVSQYVWIATLLYWGSQILRTEPKPIPVTIAEAQAMQSRIVRLRAELAEHAA